MAAIRIGGGQPPWVVAGWVFRYVMRRIDHSKMETSLAEQVCDAKEHNTGYVGLEGLSAKDLVQFRAQVERIYENLIQDGPGSLASPEFL